MSGIDRRRKKEKEKSDKGKSERNSARQLAAITFVYYQKLGGPTRPRDVCVQARRTN